MLVLRLDVPLFWANATEVVSQVLDAVDDQPGTYALLLDLEATSQLDTTSVDALDVLLDRLGARGVELYLVRVSLEESGEGLAGYVFGDEEPRIFKIRAWTYGRKAITIPLEPIGDSAQETPTLSGEVIGESMELTMKGSGWSRRVELRLEDPLEKRWSALRTGMASSSP